MGKTLEISDELMGLRKQIWAMACLSAPTEDSPAHVTGYLQNGSQMTHYLRHDGRVKVLQRENLEEMVEDLKICGYLTLSTLKYLMLRAVEKDDIRAAVVCIQEIHKRTNAYPNPEHNMVIGDRGKFREKFNRLLIESNCDIVV